MVSLLYFHRTVRCPTCLKVGRYSEEAAKVSNITFQYIDFQKDTSSAKQFGISGPTLIIWDAETHKSKKVEGVFELSRDKQRFIRHVQTVIRDFLN